MNIFELPQPHLFNPLFEAHATKWRKMHNAYVHFKDAPAILGQISRTVKKTPAYSIDLKISASPNETSLSYRYCCCSGHCNNLIEANTATTVLLIFDDVFLIPSYINCAVLFSTFHKTKSASAERPWKRLVFTLAILHMYCCYKIYVVLVLLLELSKRDGSKLFRCEIHTNAKVRGKIVKWSWRISCGICSRNVQLRCDADLKGRISSFDRRKFLINYCLIN